MRNFEKKYKGFGEFFETLIRYVGATASIAVFLNRGLILCLDLYVEDSIDLWESFFFGFVVHILFSFLIISAFGLSARISKTLNWTAYAIPMSFLFAFLLYDLNSYYDIFLELDTNRNLIAHAQWMIFAGCMTSYFMAWQGIHEYTYQNNLPAPDFEQFKLKSLLPKNFNIKQLKQHGKQVQ